MIRNCYEDLPVGSIGYNEGNEDGYIVVERPSHRQWKKWYSYEGSDILHPHGDREGGVPWDQYEGIFVQVSWDTKYKYLSQDPNDVRWERRAWECFDCHERFSDTYHYLCPKCRECQYV
jgi:hypothetical protein